MKNCKQAILFLSNKTAPGILHVFNQITESVKGLADVYFIYHQSTPEIPNEIKALNYYSFTDTILHELNFIPLEDKLLPGCDHFPLFKFYLDHPEYDYYWHIEDDVRFCGEWSFLVESYKEVDADFITSHVRKKEEEPHWFWWDSLKKNGGRVEMKNALRSFNAIHRISNAALQFLHQELSTGWSGHHEVLLPTLLYQNHFMIIDFGGDGAFVPAGKENCFYTRQSMTFIPRLMGTVKNRIYHPVKELRRNCIITVADKKSLHPYWIHEQQSYDVHLIVIDESGLRLKFQTPYVHIVNDTDLIANKNDKSGLIRNYLGQHPEYLRAYEYFFLVTQDLLISPQSIELLFHRMEAEIWEASQPTMIAEDPEKEKSVIPCLSRHAATRLLDTGALPKDIREVDDVFAVLHKDAHRLKIRNIKEIDSKGKIILSCRKMVHELKSIHHPTLTPTVSGVIERLKSCNWLNAYEIYEENLMFSLLTISETVKNKEIANLALSLCENHLNNMELFAKDEATIRHLADIGYMIEYLAKHDYIQNNTDEILGDIIRVMNDHLIAEKGFSSKVNFKRVKRYYQARMANPNFSDANRIHRRERKLYLKLLKEYT